MLTGNCIHPDLIRVLARCGHGDKVLIADGNYPLAAKSGGAEQVYLGVRPGLPTVTEVLEALQSVCAFEKAEVMRPEEGPSPEIFGEFERMLGGLELCKLGRYEFYDACCAGAVRLAVSTGEGRTFANILLTVGVAKT